MAEDKKQAVAAVDRALRLWDNALNGLMQAERAWKMFSQLVTEERLSIEEFPLPAQRILARINPHAKFFVFLERFSDVVRANGTFEEMLIGKKLEKTKQTESRLEE
jgi:hypothetical protein